MLQKEKRKGQKEVKLRFVRCYYQKVVKKKKKAWQKKQPNLRDLSSSDGLRHYVKGKRKQIGCYKTGSMGITSQTETLQANWLIRGPRVVPQESVWWMHCTADLRVITRKKKKTYKKPTICTAEIHGSSHSEMFAGAQPSSICAFQLPHTQLTGLRCWVWRSKALSVDKTEFYIWPQNEGNKPQESPWT